MPVDNQLYDRLAGTWWDDDSLLSLLRTSINPARFGYMRRMLVEELAVEPAGKATLDIGEQLPFEDGSFDIAYCCDVLEHVDDLDRVLAETSRVLTMFIKPRELEQAMARAGLHGARNKFRESRDQSLLYAGYAVKPA